MLSHVVSQCIPVFNLAGEFFHHDTHKSAMQNPFQPYKINLLMHRYLENILSLTEPRYLQLSGIERLITVPGPTAECNRRVIPSIKTSFCGFKFPRSAGRRRASPYMINAIFMLNLSPGTWSIVIEVLAAPFSTRPAQIAAVLCIPGSRSSPRLHHVAAAVDGFLLGSCSYMYGVPRRFQPQELIFNAFCLVICSLISGSESAGPIPGLGSQVSERVLLPEQAIS